MARYFNEKKIELLAPAGNFEIFKDVVNTNCDAIYFGGKNFNMRLHRKDFNFSDNELKEAVDMAHDKNKSVYITVNNLYNCSETEQVKEFLLFLEKLKPDAIIVQDFSILYFIRKLNINLPVHSSVMMNVHNIEMIKSLEKLGVTRVVMSRESSLSYVNTLSKSTNMEFEYFVHGDMCIAHGGQCFYSGILFGQSSNRGKCLKPCRWNYTKLETTNNNCYDTEFPLAVKDMYMYENIPELIHNNVTSFKIEGRMRDADYLQMIINAYGNAIDRYISDPICYDRKKETKLLHENRKRDFSTAFAFGNLGLENINKRYEGTGKFYSTGKVFSTPTPERDITDSRIKEINNILDNEEINKDTDKMNLSVRVNSIEQAEICLTNDVSAIYLSGDIFLPNKTWSKDDIRNITNQKGNTKIYLCTPHMTFDIDLEQYEMLLKDELGIDGIVSTNIGAIEKFNRFSQIGDYSLNILNKEAALFYKEEGLERFTISVEANVKETIDLIKFAKHEAELIVYGSPIVMYLEHDLYDNITEEYNGSAMLIDESGLKHPIYKNKNNRNYMLMSKDICLLPILRGLYNVGLRNCRIEGQHMEKEDFENTIKSYIQAIDDLDKCEYLFSNMNNKRGFTLGAFEFNGGL